MNNRERSEVRERITGRVLLVISPSLLLRIFAHSFGDIRDLVLRYIES